MGKLFFVLVAITIAVVSLLDLTEGKKHKESNHDKHCKKEGDPANHSFSANSMCRAENSLLTMDRSSGRKPAKSKDNHIKCECYEPGWQRCKDKSKGKNQESGTPSNNSPSNGQQGITYEENPKCHDGNSENRSKKCHRPVVLLIEEPCRCHEQRWSRCDRSSSSSTPAPAASSTAANAGPTTVSGGSTEGGASTGVSGAETQSSASGSTTVLGA